MPLISLVIPAHNEAICLPILFKEIDSVVANMKDLNPNLSFEAVVIDDGSTDETVKILKRESAASPSRSHHQFNLKWLSFSRNFGKESAILAGLRNAQGDYVAIMDADLQDPPLLLPEMYSLLKSGEYDSVATYRKDRKGEPILRSAFSKLFYKIMSRISDSEIISGARDYRLMNRKMVDAILSMSEYNRFSKGIYGWVGFKTKWIPFENIPRAAGKSNWNFFSLFSYSLEGITAFSTKPLMVSSIFGIALCFIAIIAAIVVIAKTIIFGDPVSGWPSTACIILFVGGLQLFCLGIVGQYLAKTYLETKNRPAYFTAESNIDYPK